MSVRNGFIYYGVEFSVPIVQNVTGGLNASLIECELVRFDFLAHERILLARVSACYGYSLMDFRNSDCSVETVCQYGR